MIRLFVAIFIVSCSPALAQDRAIVETEQETLRIALLIGNGKYSQTGNAWGSPLKQLRNPCNDVEQVAAALENAGWKEGTEFIKICDATLSQLKDEFSRFKDIYLSVPKSLGFFYYAGHGVQAQGDVYLFGTDAAIGVSQSVNKLRHNNKANVFPGAARLNHDLISQIGDSGDGSLFVVVDACRNTLLDDFIAAKDNEGWTDPRDSYLRPTLGMKVLYSTAYGTPAADGAGNTSPFAEAFVGAMRQQGDIDELVKVVVKNVTLGTQSRAIKQKPDTSGSLNPPPPEACLTNCS